MNKKDILTDFIYNGLKGINDITENIDFQKTTKEFLKSQLNNSLNNSFLKIVYKNNDTQIDETFFTFLKDNDNFFKNLKIFTISSKDQESLQNHISTYFQNIHTRYNEDKMFYFYFQLILMDSFLEKMGKNLPKRELKEELMDVLKNKCFMEKKEMSKCLGDHMNEIDVIPISDFDNKVKNKCDVPKNNLEQCLIKNIRKNN